MLFREAVGPGKLALAEMQGGQKDSAGQIRFRLDRSGKKRGIEHLESDIGRSDTDASQFPDLASLSAGGKHAKRLPQIVGYPGEIHWQFQYLISP